MMMHLVLNQLNAVQSGNQYTVTLSNGKTITSLEKPVHNGNEYLWKVDTQYFSNDLLAAQYLQNLIIEKMTGIRVIFHAEKKIPDICGIDGAACQNPGQYNSALCMGCPVAERFLAERDDVKLIYAVTTIRFGKTIPEKSSD